MTFGGLYQNTCPNSMTGDAGILFLTLINTLFVNQCQLGNKDDYPTDAGPSLIENDIFDYIIVGAGTSGSVVASKLAKSTQNKILLLEAGGYPSPTSDIPALHSSLQKTVEDWQFHTEKSDESCLSFKNGRCLWPSGKVLGGTSTINSMLYMRGNKHSYNMWAEHGNIGWSYQEVQSYFKKSEKLEAHELLTSHIYGTEGVLPLTRTKFHQPIRNTILDSAKEMGYKISNHETAPGFFEAVQTIHKGVRKNIAKVFLADHKLLPNLKVATEALVEKILIDKDLKEANGVTVNIAGRTLNLYAEKEVIITAGTVNSPKLLMLSGVGPKEHLAGLGIEVHHDIKVGQNLQDHLMYPLFVVKINSSAVKYLQQNPTEELYNYFANREGSFTNTGLGNIVGLISTKNYSGDANIKLGYLLLPHQDSYVLSLYKRNFNLDDAIIKSLGEANKHSHLLIIYITLMDTRSRGKLLLKSRNPHEKPLIYSGYLTNEKDIENMLKGIRIAEKQTETPAFKKISAEVVHVDIPNCRQHAFRTEEYWKCAIRNTATTGYYPTGTCKMGLSIDPDAVVDPLMRVHGITKLRVGDSSIIPSGTRSNLAATAIMIGQKTAQVILNGFKFSQEE